MACTRPFAAAKPPATGGRGLHRACEGLQRHVHDAGHRGRRESAEGAGRGPRRHAGDVPDRVRGDRPTRPRFRQVHGLQAGLRPHGTDHVGPERVSAVRHGRRHPERRPSQCARGAQHPRRALGDLQGRVRCAAGHAAAGRRARGLREVPQAAGCARDGRGARREVRHATPISKRCRCTAWRWPSRPSTTPRTCAPRAAAT